MNTNPYLSFVQSAVAIRDMAKLLPLGGIETLDERAISRDAPVVLLFSPHPDDECIVGGLPLRLLRECGWRVVNVVVTQGSKKERRPGRLEEVRGACNYLQFEVCQTDSGGFEDINFESRKKYPEVWKRKVGFVVAILSRFIPKVIFLPHEGDVNTTHVGTHHLVVDALKLTDPQSTYHVFETEFWGQISNPNLMVESPLEDVADLMAACSFHKGEVSRNPYHLNQIAWMQDNVRRGAELVGGQGGEAPNFNFATLYRYRPWVNGNFDNSENVRRRKILSAGSNLADFFS